MKSWLAQGKAVSRVGGWPVYSGQVFSIQTGLWSLRYSQDLFSLRKLESSWLQYNVLSIARSSLGALLKACFCLLDIVTLPSSEPLSAQLQRKYQAGFELHTWSTAPQGSGLGTSSILAGAILAALLRVTDRTASLDSLIHAVMIVEQMLTTGGGWQDNAGGLVPGFKMTRSQASLPLKVEVEPLNLSQATVDAVTKRLLCLFSGKPRLAKNLLQVIKQLFVSHERAIKNVS